MGDRVKESCCSTQQNIVHAVMNRLEKESLKKSVPFEELRELRLAAFSLKSQDANSAFVAAVALSRIVTISNCEIMIDEDVVSGVFQLLRIGASNDHVAAACNLLLAMFPHELESVQENILKASGIQFLHATLKRWPDSAAKIVETLQQCVHFFNSGQNVARESGVLESVLELHRTFADDYDTHSCIHAMCHLNYQNSRIAETHGLNVQYRMVFPQVIDAGNPVASPTSQNEPQQARGATSMCVLSQFFDSLQATCYRSSKTIRC